MYHVLLYLLLIVLLLAGLAINLFNLPGLWLMAAATAGYEILTKFAYAGIKTLVALFVLAAVAEILEFTSAGKAAKRAGASRRGFWGAIVGGLAGGIVLTGLIPIPVVGTVFGICLGTFLGALIAELAGGAKIHISVRVGVGAAKGRFVGMIIKLGFGFVMLIVTVVAAFPIHGAHSSHPSIPPTRPATRPTSEMSLNSPPAGRPLQRAAS